VQATPVAAEDTTLDAGAASGSGEELARTGLPAWLLAAIGLGLLTCGTLIHLTLLRLAPHSGYARAMRLQPLHQAPRLPGVPPPRGHRRVRRPRR
jgi:hypothetical protein